MRRALLVGAIVIGALLVIVGGGILVFSQTDFGRERVRRQALKFAGKAAHGVVRMGRVEGNLLTGITVHDLSITDSSGAPFIAAPRASLRYSLRDFVNKKLYFSHVRLDRPVIVLDKRPGGKWNYDRIFPRSKTKSDTSKHGFGSWVALTDVKLSNGRIIVRAPWHPNDTLSAAARDSVAAAALGGESRLLVERVPGGFQKISDFRQIDATLPRLRLADPATKVRLLEVAQLRMTALPFRPPAAEVRDLAGTFEFTGDSAWWANVRAQLPGSQLGGAGRYDFDSGDFRLRLRAAPAALADLRWVLPRLPSEGGGTADFAMDWVGEVEDYQMRNGDIRIGAARLAGDFGIAMSDTFAFHDTDVRFADFDTRLIEQILPFAKSPRRGTLGGRATVSGGKGALALDADVTFDDPRSGRSRVVAVGEAGFGDAFRARDLRLTLAPVQVELARVAMPTLPVRGTLTGTAALDGSTATALVARADLVHVDRGERSHVTGSGEVRPREGRWMDIDVRAAPISLVTVGRFAPALGLRGSAAGPVRVTGTLGDLAVRTHMHMSPGGSLLVRGRLDLASAEKGYDLAAAARVFDAHRIITKAPSTSLTATAAVRGRGTDPATMRATIRADMETSSYDSIPFDSAKVRISVADGTARLDTVALRGPNAWANAAGTFGLAAGHEGVVSYRLAVDTLGAFARLMPKGDTGAVAPRPGRIARAVARARADSARLAEAGEVERAVTGQPPVRLAAVSTPTPVRRDSLSGALYTAGTMRGSLKKFDLRGRASLTDIVARGSVLQSARAEYGWVGAPSTGSTLIVAAHAESLSAAGFGFDSADARVLYRNRAGTFAVVIHQPERQEFSAAGDYTLHLEHSEVHFRDLALNFDTTRWVAARPGSVRWGKPGFEFDSIDLRHGRHGRIYVNGLLPTAGRANLEVAIDNFEVGNLVDLLQSDVDVHGLVSLHAQAEGTLREPRFRGAAGLARGVYGGTPIPDLRSKFEYAGASLRAHAEATRATGSPILVADATLPVNLGVGITGPRLPDRPLIVDVTADSLPLEVLPKFTDAVANVRGRAIGQVRVRGTVRHPTALGAIALDLGSFQLVSTGVTYRDMMGTLRLRRDTLMIDSIVAYNTGRVYLRGGLGLKELSKPSFDLHLVASNARLLDNSMGRLWADAGIAINGPFDRVYVSGGARIRRGVIFAPEPGARKVISAGDPALFSVADTSVASTRELLPGQSPLLANMRVDVTLGVERDTWVRRSDANVEIFTPPETGDLEIHVDRRRQQLSLAGVVSTERGEYSFLSKRFQITRGSATFIGATEINPTLQITGENEVRLAGREALAIRVIIGGTLENPRVSLESDAQPPLAQSDLLSYLAFGRSSSSLLQGQSEGSSLATSTPGGSLVGPAAALATSRLAGVAVGVLADQLEGQAARSLGADMVNVTPADVPTEAWRGDVTGFLKGTAFELGKYTDPNTFLAVQANADYRSPPGISVERRSGKGYRVQATWAPRYVLTPATLDASSQDLPRTSVFGMFLIREWKY